MLFNLQQRLRSLRMLVRLAAFLKQPDSLESVFKVSASLKNSTLSALVDGSVSCGWLRPTAASFPSPAAWRGPAPAHRWPHPW